MPGKLTRRQHTSICWVWSEFPGGSKLQVSVTNRQRAIDLDLSGYRAMVASLSQELCSNLMSKPSKQTSDVDIKAVCKRASISVVLTSNRTIRRLNKQWRGKDSATDVLSFTILLEQPPKEMPWELGEIFISVEQAAAQAHSFKHSLEREMAFLTVHGLLHLLGFDHELPAEEKEMMVRSEKILNAAGYPR